MSELLIHVDAFTDHAFGGNPAAVLILDHERDVDWMQAMARETNLPATAFVCETGLGIFELRWFTVKDELVLCGHGTLASAHALWREGGFSSTQSIRFETRGGQLTARLDEDWITLDFPVEPAEPVEPPRALLEALGVKAVEVARNRLDYLVLLDSEQRVATVTPDFAQLLNVETRGIIVTALSASPDVDFVSRFFCPSVGVQEDPVTGSAHCALGPFWGKRLGKDVLQARQLSARGGMLRVTNRGSRVDLAGQAVTVLRGTFRR